VDVSWYEAVTFCLWLREASGERISLPTEQQWQRAAQGDDHRVFPWGNDWNGNRCNNGKGIRQTLTLTTPVRAYEGKGDSPFGVVDMVGNVSEWCLTTYDTGSMDVNGTGARVLRGGSWIDDSTDDFRCDYRSWNNPQTGSDTWCFRLALS